MLDLFIRFISCNNKDDCEKPIEEGVDLGSKGRHFRSTGVPRCTGRYRIVQYAQRYPSDAKFQYTNRFIAVVARCVTTV